MAEGDTSSGIKIEGSSPKCSLFTTLKSLEVAKIWPSKDEVSKLVSKLKKSKEVSLDIDPHEVDEFKVRSI